MLKFFHTSDWHFGLRASNTAHIKDANKMIRQARLNTLERVRDLAKEHQIDFMLMAGDIFDHHHVDLKIVSRVLQILNEFHCPVYLTTGNHDYHDLQQSIYHYGEFKQVKPNVQIITAPTVIKDDRLKMALYISPLLVQKDQIDPTQEFKNLDQNIPNDYFKIGMSHGSLTHIGVNTEDYDFPISVDIVDELNLNYLALGHWHSYLTTKEDKVVYCGTPEPTQFNERDSGNICLVEIENAQSMPKLKKIKSATLNWIYREKDLSEFPREMIKSIYDELQSIGNDDNILFRLKLKGSVPPSLSSDLAILKTNIQARPFIIHEIDDSEIRLMLNQEELEQMLSSSDVLKSVYAELIAKQNNNDENIEVIENALNFINSTLSIQKA